MKNENIIVVNAIYAVGRNGEMGNADGSLPWRTIDSNGNQIIREDLPPEVIAQAKSDMENFKRLTTGNIVIMGYNTYRTFSDPLPNRVNIVVDRTCNIDCTSDCHTTSTFNTDNADSCLGKRAVASDVTPKSNGWFFAPTLESAITLAEKIASESQQQKNDNPKANTLVEDNGIPQKEIFIIGGAKILQEAFRKNLVAKTSGKVYKTVINADFPEATVRLL